MAITEFEKEQIKAMNTEELRDRYFDLGMGILRLTELKDYVVEELTIRETETKEE